MHLRISRISRLAAILLVSAVSAGTAFAQQFQGAIFTTDNAGVVGSLNTKYGDPDDVYVTGGSQTSGAARLADGTYYFQVTDSSGERLLSTDNASCRQVTVTGGKVDGTTGPCAHAKGAVNPANGLTPVQLSPFSATRNDGAYKVWFIRKGGSTSISQHNPRVINFSKSNSKSENFRLSSSSAIPMGSCQPSNSMSVTNVGKYVFSFVPKGSWQNPVKDVVLMSVEPDSGPIKRIPTNKAVSSCASNPRTLQTVCTSNENDVYVLTGPFVTSTLKTMASGMSIFNGGSCTNCGVTMDAIHNEALIGLSLTQTSGFQYMDLGLRPRLEAEAFVSQAPPLIPGSEISKGILIDPNRSWILSANGSGTYEIIKVARQNFKPRDDDDRDDRNGKYDDDDRDWWDWVDNRSDRGPKAFFENNFTDLFFSSAAEDCSTGIALATVEFSMAPEPDSKIYLADLNQATFTPGSPSGTWTAGSASKVETLTGSVYPFGPAGIAVAQGTHVGIVAGMSSDSITAIKLPSTSGTGAPGIKDYVTCRISGITGNAPHTVNAYQSPNNGHAMAVIRDLNATTLWRVDLTEMLKLPRIGKTCSDVFLPAKVVRTIAVP